MRRQLWERISEIKKRHRMLFGCIEPDCGPIYFSSEVLLGKAMNVAKQLGAFGFTQEIGLFGSTARGEKARDVDLLIFDYGEVSDKALALLQSNKYLYSISMGSAGNYARACYLAFSDFMPGKDILERLSTPFYENIREHPIVDMLFVNRKIRYEQSYLDEIVRLGMPDPYFFRNISRDLLLYRPGEQEFRKVEVFPRFVNDGIPSKYLLEEILGKIDDTEGEEE